MKPVGILIVIVSLLFFSTKTVFADTLITGNSSVTVNSSTSVSTNTGGGGTTNASQTIDTNVNGQQVHLQSNTPNGSSTVEVHQEGNNPPTTKIQTTDPNAEVKTNITPSPTVVVKKSDDIDGSPSTPSPDTESSPSATSSIDNEISTLTAQLENLGKNSQVNDFADKMGNLIAQLTAALIERSRQLMAQFAAKFSL